MIGEKFNPNSDLIRTNDRILIIGKNDQNVTVGHHIANQWDSPYIKQLDEIQYELICSYDNLSFLGGKRKSGSVYITVSPHVNEKDINKNYDWILNVKQTTTNGFAPYIMYRK